MLQDFGKTRAASPRDDETPSPSPLSTPPSPPIEGQGNSPRDRTPTPEAEPDNLMGLPDVDTLVQHLIDAGIHMADENYNEVALTYPDLS